MDEKYLLVTFIEGKPKINAALYFDTKEELLEHYERLPKIKGFKIEYTICTIHRPKQKTK